MSILKTGIVDLTAAELHFHQKKPCSLPTPLGKHTLTQYMLMLLVLLPWNLQESTADLLSREIFPHADICAGTSCGSLICAALTEAVCTGVDSATPFPQVFTAENDAKTRSHLFHRFPGSILVMLGDITLWPHHDFVRNFASDEYVNWKRIKAGFVWAGFPCVDASYLNPWSRSSKHSSCIRDGSLSTGSTFQAVLKYLTETEVPLACLENVVGLLSHHCTNLGQQLPSNYDEVCRALRFAGFLCFTYLTSPKFHGCPQSRPRIYFVVVNARWLITKATRRDPNRWEDSSHIQRALERKLTAILKLFATTWDVLPLDAFVDKQDPAPDRTVDVVNEDGRSAVFRWKPQKCPMQWSHGNRDELQAGKLPKLQTLQRNPGLLELSHREYNCLFYHGYNPDVEEFKPWMELSQNPSRTGRVAGHVAPCICPHSRQFIPHLQRFLRGCEALRSQGVFYPDGGTTAGPIGSEDPPPPIVDDDESYDDDFLMRLAGNAFNGFVASAIQLALFASLSELI